MIVTRSLSDPTPPPRPVREKRRIGAAPFVVLAVITTALAVLLVPAFRPDPPVLFADPGTYLGTLAATADPETAAAIAEVTSYPVARWLTDSDPAKAAAAVTDVISRAEPAGATPIFVTYAIPDRDCGSHSAGGTSLDTYDPWTAAVAEALTIRSIVIVEPDAIGQLEECSDADERLALLRTAVERYAAAGADVYLDAGNSTWIDPITIAGRLEAAGVHQADGFAVNVSNYNPTADEVAYATRISTALDGAHYVVDTSRNGSTEVSDHWCNPTGAGLGTSPRLFPGDEPLDAYLWLKTPGLSDGECGGGPPAGELFPEQIQALVANAHLGLPEDPDEG